MGTNEAPVKKAILAAGLGGNVVSYTSGDLLQPHTLIILQNAKPEVAREFRRVIEDECLRLVKEGIPRERLAAILANEEFDLRQRDYGYADGVALACDALGTWLYDDADEAATRGIEYGPIYEELNRELDGTYFEDLLRELVLESKHRALVELVPVADDAAASREEEAELAAAKAAMDDADLQRIVEDVAALRERQEAEDAPEARATRTRGPRHLAAPARERHRPRPSGAAARRSRSSPSTSRRPSPACATTCPPTSSPTRSPTSTSPTSPLPSCRM